MDSSFINIFTRTFRKSFSFEGRASRKELWQWNFAALNAMAIFEIILPALYPKPTFELICSSFVIICMLLPSLSIFVRRCHDLGYGKWFILLIFIPLVNIFQEVYILSKAGNKEANKYGPVPIDHNLTTFDKVWLWTFVAITIVEFGRRLYFA